MSNEGQNFLKVKSKEAARSSYRTYNNNVPWHLSESEIIALQNLFKKDLMIQKSDNGNSVVIIGRQDYIKKMNILIDQKKFIKGNLKMTLYQILLSTKKKTLIRFSIKVRFSKGMEVKAMKLLKPVGSRPDVV